MSSTLPSTRYDEGSLRLVLLPENEDGEDSIASPGAIHEDPFDDLPTLTSARYGDPSPIPSPVSQYRSCRSSVDTNRYTSRDQSRDNSRISSRIDSRDHSRAHSRESRGARGDNRSNVSLDGPDSDVDADEYEVHDLDHDLDHDHADDFDDDEDSESHHNVPVHPIPSLQDAFAESLLEVTGGTTVGKPKLRLLDSLARREALLCQGKDDAPFDAAWRLRPGQSQHEVAKLISQIAFGVHLLLDGNANSNVQVVDILQGHIDEVDEFLEVILEDVAEAENDVAARLDELTMPMADMASFEKLLEDRKYRAELIEGNQVIEHALARTNAALRLWEDDVDAGLHASNAFIDWLNEHTDGRWRLEQPNLLEIFDAMNGNAEGWLLAFERVSEGAQELTGQILKLMNTMAELEKKAGEVSRKNWTNIVPFSTPGGALGRANSGASTPASSFRSFPRKSIGRISLGSGSITRARPPSSIISDMSDESDNLESPTAQHVSIMLPGLRPPPANSGPSQEDDGFRLSPVTYSPVPTQKSPSPGPSVTPQIHEDDDAGEECQATQSPVFVLQPRTYTPQPPAPIPSPRMKEYQGEPGDHHEQERNRDNARTTPSTFQSNTYSHSRSSTQSSFSVNGRVQTWQSSVASVQKRSSLRQRVSLKSSPPRDIRIPSRSLEGMEVYAHSNHSTPRSTASTTHGSEDYRRQYAPASASQRSCESPGVYSAASSPQREQRLFRPVMASPHSPLQQRPHTAVASSQPTFHHTSSLVPPPLLRNRPSQMSTMSVTSDHTSRSLESRGPATMSLRSEDKLKKKKSAFGWLKKAFSMDEDERAAYEARKAMAGQERYHPHYDASGPSNQNKFIDGRRVRR